MVLVFVLILAFIWLSSDNDDSLQLLLLHVLGSERHDELLNGTVDAADHDVVLDVGVILQCGLSHVHALLRRGPNIELLSQLVLLRLLLVEVV